MSPTREWLESLQGVLRTLQPTSLALLEGLTLEREARWCASLPATASLLDATEGFDPAAASGWLIRLHVREGGTRALYVGVEAGKQVAPDEPSLILAVALCRLAWRLHRSKPLPPGPPVPELRDAIHSLRNGLNSVLMTASVLTTAELPEHLQVFATDLDRSAAQSLQALRELMTLVAPE